MPDKSGKARWVWETFALKTSISEHPPAPFSYTQVQFTRGNYSHTFSVHHVNHLNQKNHSSDNGMRGTFVGLRLHLPLKRNRNDE